MAATLESHDVGRDPAAHFSGALRHLDRLISGSTSRAAHVQLSALRAEILAGIAHLESGSSSGEATLPRAS